MTSFVCTKLTREVKYDPMITANIIMTVILLWLWYDQNQNCNGREEEDDI